MIIIPIIIVVLIIVFFVYAQTKKTGQINNVCAILLENNFQVKQKVSQKHDKKDAGRNKKLKNIVEICAVM